MTVLVIAAHPDDEVLGCGGTVARLASSGVSVDIAILGEGMTSRQAKREDTDQQNLDALQSHSRAAGKILGAREVVHYELPDNRFDELPLLDVVKVVEQLVERFEPDTIYTHHQGDLNVDHTVIHRAVLTGTRPIPGHPVKDVYAFEVASSSEWSFGRLGAFDPNVFVEITDTLEAKADAMCCYESEIRSFPHPRSVEAVRAIAKRWGSVVGCPAAEAFELVRSVR